MDWLNYHHLHYFWRVAREGSITAASQVLNLSQSALSAQIRSLEQSLGERLFEKEGRGLRLTESGRLAYRYADEIFTLGGEFQNALRGRPTGRPLRLVVGATDVLPKLMVHRLLKPALGLEEPLRLDCREGSVAQLYGALFSHELDLVFTDAPFSAAEGPRAFNHLLGECGVDCFGTAALRKRHPAPFPRCLDGAPMLLPPEGTRLRQGLERWFQQADLHPVIAGEFADSALLKTFGAEGEGFFAAPAALASEVVNRYQVKRLGTVPDLKERFYAVSLARRVIHPGVKEILRAAKEEVFL